MSCIHEKLRGHKESDQTYSPNCLTVWMKVIRGERQDWWALGLMHKVEQSLAAYTHTHTHDF